MPHFVHRSSRFLKFWSRFASRTLGNIFLLVFFIFWCATINLFAFVFIAYCVCFAAVCLMFPGIFESMADDRFPGGAEIAGVENAEEGKVWKAKVLKMCF